MLQRWKLRRGQQDQSLQSGSDPVCTVFPFSPTPSSVSHSPLTGRTPHILRGNSHSFSLSSHLVVRSKSTEQGSYLAFCSKHPVENPTLSPTPVNTNGILGRKNMLSSISLFGYFCSIFLHLNVKDLNHDHWSLSIIRFCLGRV